MSSNSCPRCTGPMNHPRVALSRFDNETYVCSACGTDEALYQHEVGSVPDFNYILIGGLSQRKPGRSYI